MRTLPSLQNSKNVLKVKSTAFAFRIIRLIRHVQQSQREFVLTKQLLRSGTSIGANIRESEYAESPSDFVHKLGSAQKEANETIYWLELFFADGILSEPEFQSIYADAEELMKLLTSSIKTKKKNGAIKISNLFGAMFSSSFFWAIH